MDNLFLGLKNKMEQSGIGFNVEKIEMAYEFAREAHSGQMRQSGDPYITHPVAVAEILIDLGLDTDSIIGGLLHDVVEDTPVELDTVKKAVWPGCCASCRRRDKARVISRTFA